MDNSLLAVRGINHKYIVVEVSKDYIDFFKVLDSKYPKDNKIRLEDNENEIR